MRKNILAFLVVLLTTTFCSYGFANDIASPRTESSTRSLKERNHFTFAIPKYETKRQSGQVVNIYVKFAYKEGLPTSEYVDYRLMREKILKWMEPSPQFPAEIYWEILAAEMGKELMQNYPIEGVSVQLEVLDNQNPNSFEPGNHGPIFTMGNIEPLSIHY